MEQSFHPTDFFVKRSDQLIKVKNCSYNDEKLKKQNFYFCVCNSQEFYPICEECANTCHKHV